MTMSVVGNWSFFTLVRQSSCKSSTADSYYCIRVCIPITVSRCAFLLLYQGAHSDYCIRVRVPITVSGCAFRLLYQGARSYYCIRVRVPITVSGCAFLLLYQGVQNFCVLKIKQWWCCRPVYPSFHLSVLWAEVVSNPRCQSVIVIVLIHTLNF